VILKKLKSAGFTFKKGLGQNFIVDEGFLSSVVGEFGLSKDDIVVEVGTGAGTLTRVIAPLVKNVITFEVDERLKPILAEQFNGFDNIELRFIDALSRDAKMPDVPYKVVANVPYYITTPLLLKFISDPNCVEVCVLVQEELGMRIVAKLSTKDYGALSIAMQAWGNFRIVRKVGRGMFVPPPNVDSAFVQGIRGEGELFDSRANGFLKGLFANRRKTIENGLCAVLGCGREDVRKILADIGINVSLRPENLSVEDFKKLIVRIRQN